MEFEVTWVRRARRLTPFDPSDRGLPNQQFTEAPTDLIRWGPRAVCRVTGPPPVAAHVLHVAATTSAESPSARETGEEVLGDGSGDKAAALALLDEHRERDVALVADEPGVGLGRGLRAVLGRPGLAVDDLGRGSPSAPSVPSRTTSRMRSCSWPATVPSSGCGSRLGLPSGVGSVTSAGGMNDPRATLEVMTASESGEARLRPCPIEAAALSVLLLFSGMLPANAPDTPSAFSQPAPIPSAAAPPRVRRRRAPRPAARMPCCTSARSRW